MGQQPRVLDNDANWHYLRSHVGSRKDGQGSHRVLEDSNYDGVPYFGCDMAYQVSMHSMLGSFDIRIQGRYNMRYRENRAKLPILGFCLRLTEFCMIKNCVRMGLCVRGSPWRVCVEYDRSDRDQSSRPLHSSACRRLVVAARGEVNLWCWSKRRIVRRRLQQGSWWLIVQW